MKKINIVILFICFACKSVPCADYYLPSDIAHYRGKIVQAVILEPPSIEQEKSFANYLRKLIEISPGYDILSPEAISRSLEALYKTGRFSGITVYSQKSVKGITVIFKFQKALLIKDIEYLNLPRSIRKKIQYLIAIQKNKPFSEKALQDNVVNSQATLRKIGYPDATVTYQVIPYYNEFVKIKIYFVLGKSLPIKKIKIITDGVASSSEVSRKMLRSLTIKEGIIYDEDAINDSIRKTIDKFQKDGFVGTSISYKAIMEQDHGVVLQITGDSGIKPIVQITGYHLSKKEIKNLVSLQKEQAISDALLNNWAKNIKDFLNEKKLYNPEVRYNYDQEKALIAFSVRPGTRYKILKINWEGNTCFTSSQLDALQLFQKAYVESKAENELNRLKNYYKESGFLKSETKIAKITHYPPDTLEVTIYIKEGVQTEIEKINIYGLTAFTDTYLKTLLKTFKVSYFSPLIIQRDIQLLHNEYLAHGYLNVAIHYTLSAAEQKNKVIVDLRINESSKVTIDRVLINGNYATNPAFIEKYFDIKSDNPLLYKIVLSTQKKLYDLGIFNKVDIVYPRFSTYSPTIDLTVKLDESSPYVVSYGAGYQQEDKVRAFISLVRNNMFGYGIRNELLLRYGFIEKRIFYSFYQPRFLNLPFHALASASYEEQSRASFDFHKKAVSLQVEFPVTSTARYLLEYNFNYTNTYNLKIPELEIDRKYRDINVSSVALIFIQDKRNDFFEPTHGYFYSGSLELAPKLLHSQQQFLKFYTQFQIYHQLFNRLTFAFSTRLGMIQSYMEKGFVPISMRFFAGGSKSFRGTALDRLGPIYEEVPLGGKALFINNFEIRFELAKNIRVIAFYDLGSVWRKVVFMTYGKEYRQAVGLGIRYSTPVGPVAFDVGRLLHKLLNEDTYHYYLSIGNSF